MEKITSKLNPTMTFSEDLGTSDKKNYEDNFFYIFSCHILLAAVKSIDSNHYR